MAIANLSCGCGNGTVDTITGRCTRCNKMLIAGRNSLLSSYTVTEIEATTGVTFEVNKVWYKTSFTEKRLISEPVNELDEYNHRKCLFDDIVAIVDEQILDIQKSNIG